jgi:hypothetical protein
VSFESKVIPDKKIWKEIKEQWIDSLENIVQEEASKELIKNKIGSLNQLPQKLILDRFLETLGIEVTNLEKSAWNHRNLAAHGSISNSGKDWSKLVRETKLLRLMANRIVISACEASDFYYDYYTAGYPIRHLTHGIE